MLHYIMARCSGSATARALSGARLPSCRASMRTLGLALTALACGSPSIARQPAGTSGPPPPAALHIGALHAERFRIPESIRSEHERIHAALASAARGAGRVGDAALELARLLQPHFEREEQIALPPLGLLAPLAGGEFSPELQDVLPLTDALRSELPQMLREHEEIAAATRRLEQAAVDAGDLEAARLASELSSHAKSEEEVFYPAAILVGEVVRARAASATPPSARE